MRKRLRGGGESSAPAAGFKGMTLGAISVAGSERVERLGDATRVTEREEVVLKRVMSDSLLDKGIQRHRALGRLVIRAVKPGCAHTATN